MARHAGGVESLLAIGFVERETLEGDDSSLHYVLEEPVIGSTVEEVERWASWFDGLKARRDELGRVMAAAGMPALPTATHSLGWDEKPTLAPPARMMEGQVMHGQLGCGM